MFREKINIMRLKCKVNVENQSFNESEHLLCGFVAVNQNQNCLHWPQSLGYIWDYEKVMKTT